MLSWVSGNPMSIVSGFGTWLREDFSGENMVNTPLTRNDLDNALQFRMTGNGPYFVPATAIGSDGRGVNPSTALSEFEGQLFTNPTAGTIGALQRRSFSGPPVFNMDAALYKDTKVNEHLLVELRLEALNVFNHAAFAVFSNNLTVNSQQFGQVTNAGNDAEEAAVGDCECNFNSVGGSPIGASWRNDRLKNGIDYSGRCQQVWSRNYAASENSSRVPSRH